jgi:LysR family transcriptional regulator, carnitine catabolism transcriptional activator
VKHFYMIEFSSRQLRAFLLVAQHHNFTRAAEALFITPSGLSQLIRELESQLGFRLFDRTTRHVVLTPHGTRLLAVARRSLADLDVAVSRIGQTVKEANATLSVGTPLLTAANVLPGAIREFRSLRPDVRIQLFDGDIGTIVQRIRAGSLDLGFGLVESAPGISRTRFFRFPLMAIHPEDGTAPRRSTMAWSALKGQPLILQAPPAPLRQLIDTHLTRAGVDPRAAMSLNRLDTVIAMVEAAQGVGIVPASALPVCRYRHVMMTRLVNPTVMVDFYQIHHRGRKLSPAADEFSTFLQGYIARWAGRAGMS